MRIVLTGALTSLSWEPILLLRLVDEPAFDATITGARLRAAFVGTVPPYVPDPRAPSPLERAEELGVLIGVMEAFTAGVCTPPGLEGLRAQFCLC